MRYNQKELIEVYRHLGIRSGDNVHFKSEFISCGFLEIEGVLVKDKTAFLEAQYRALREVIGETGTIIVNTSSNNIIGQNPMSFDLYETPCDFPTFNEWFRKREGVIRSFHPFMSCAAEGPLALEFCSDVSRSDFGPFTPWQRMVDRDVKEIAFGIHPAKACTIIHNVEYTMGVPYRYVKEFAVKVNREGLIKEEPFYRFVWYKNLYHGQIEPKRDQNRKIWAAFEESKFDIRKKPLGKNFVWSYRMKDFCDSSFNLIKKNPYAWLAELPENRPYSK